MKPETQGNAATETVSRAIRILKIATCPSMSGKSKLTYHIGGSANSEILFRVYANTASGFFSKEWITLTAIQQLFGKAPKADAITSFALMPLFKGKSINTPAFLFAGLLNEGLVKPSTTTKRCYECTDSKKFFAEVKALAASKVDLTEKIQKTEAKSEKNRSYREAEKREEAAINAQRDARGRGREIDTKPPKVKTVASAKASAKASPKEQAVS